MAHSYFPVHSHSRFSWLDGMPSVMQMAQEISSHGQVGFGLTDHGVMGGWVRLYKACKELDLAPFPGVELYIVHSLDKESVRHHIGALALDYRGYKALIQLNNMTHDSKHFFKKPRVSFAEFCKWGSRYGKHVAVTTGCFFGLIQQALFNNGEKAAEVILLQLAKSFPNLYVELQHHNIKQTGGKIESDYEMCVALFDLAQKHGLPVVVGQDSHYCTATDKTAHEMMKKLGYKTSDDSEVMFPGDSYHLASTPWIAKHFVGLKAAWQAADDGHEDLLSKHKLILPALEKYKFMVPEISVNADDVLKRRTLKALQEHFLDVMDPYTQRVDYELGIIKEMGFANYFLLFDDVIKWTREQGILVNARGSANGCLILFLLGITNVDPVLRKVSFDRFMHPSRKKPPDIDMDVDRDRRPEMLAHLSNMFNVVSIGTYGRLTDANDRGAIFQKYLGWKRQQMGDVAFKQSEFARIEQLRELERLAPTDMPALRKLAGMDILTGGGTHAAGVVLETDAQPISAYLPLMRVGGMNGSLVTAFDDDDVEECGYVKGDFLGLAALTTVYRCLTMIGRDPVKGLNWIKDDDKDACKLLREGLTGTGIFQFEGYSTAIGAKQMGVKTTDDAILALALFRPAAQKSGHTDEYLEYRKGKRKPTYLHPIFKQVAGDTYGVFVMQDQVLDALRAFGMSYEDLNDMLKAVKASNHNIALAEKTFERIRPTFLKLCVAAGMSGIDSKKAWGKIMDFSDYGFGKAHATSYGLFAYRMAFLKAHYTKEFMTSLLMTWAGVKEKEPMYVGEARRLGIRIAKPDVNKSEISWTLDKQGLLRRGLVSIPHVGEPAAREVSENKPYKSISDLIARCNGTTGMVTGGKMWAKQKTLNGVLGHLEQAGALDSIKEK
jgi:DNA polymerase III subunit alpha